MHSPFINITFKNSDPQSFINFWSDFIRIGKNDRYYTDRINKSKFNHDDIDRFYEWKNGMQTKNHFQKNISVEKIKANLDHINSLKKNFDIDQFNVRFKDISAIWQIFLLHIISPKKYPIFDQHVYRANKYLLTKTKMEIPKNKKAILTYYHELYIPFFEKLSKSVDNPRKVDQALVALGQFLLTKYSKG